MGAICDEVKDRHAVDMLRHDMPVEAREWLSHHLRNSLAAIMAGNEMGNRELVGRAADHMLEDLRRIGV